MTIFQYIFNPPPPPLSFEVFGKHLFEFKMGHKVDKHGSAGNFL